MQASRPRVAVVGHVEWVQFARVPHVPCAGEVVHAHDPFEEPAGGGGVAAVQLARLAGAATFLTALGRDELGERSVARLKELGVDVHAT
jgi:ribokinase